MNSPTITFFPTKVSGNKGVAITEYLGEGGVVKIPSTLGGEPVIMIEDDVFNESGVTDIYFETEGMICIAPFAFAGCTTLSSVVIKGNEDTEPHDRGKVYEHDNFTTKTTLFIKSSADGTKFGVSGFQYLSNCNMHKSTSCLKCFYLFSAKILI